MVEIYHHLPRDDWPSEKKARGSAWDATLLDLSFLKLSNYQNTQFLLSSPSQKPSHGDISGPKSGIIDPKCFQNEEN